MLDIEPFWAGPHGGSSHIPVLLPQPPLSPFLSHPRFPKPPLQRLRKTCKQHPQSSQERLKSTDELAAVWDARAGGRSSSSGPLSLPFFWDLGGSFGQSDGTYRLLNMKEQSRVDTAARTYGEAGSGVREGRKGQTIH